MDTILNSEEVVIEEPSNTKIAQEESKNATVDPIMEIHIEKSCKRVLY